MIFTVNKLLNVKAFYNKQFSHDDSGMVLSDGTNRAGALFLKVTGHKEGREGGGCESGVQLTDVSRAQTSVCMCVCV